MATRGPSTLDPYAPDTALEAAPRVVSGEVLDAPDSLIPADGNWTRASMKRFLEAQPTRAVAISRDTANDKAGVASYHDVWYQGFRYPILRGRSVPVPEPIAQIVDVMDQDFRTSQARNQAAFLNDVSSDKGAEIRTDGGQAR